SSQNNLDTLFYEGEDIESLIRARASCIDEILSTAWSRFSWEQNLNSWRKKRISLLAVGGYGRGELHPHSDIDLLILLERNTYQQNQQNIQSFITLLWDIGLKVGHSVRSISECKTQANRDVTIVTSLMESRTLCGDDILRQMMLKKVGPEKIWPPHLFYQAKIEEQLDRHQKFNHTEYSLEPNVKTSPGGLRDIQTVMWIARRKFGAVTFEDLVDKAFITHEESRVLNEARKFLWRVRYGLHLVAGKNDDRLLFEYQKRLATIFGYEDAETLAVEQFMKNYYRSAQELYATNELLLQHFDETIVRHKEKVKHVHLNERFKAHSNYIEVIHDKVFKTYPPALIEMFVLAGDNPQIEGIRTATIRLARQSVELIDDEFRSNPETTALFLDLLRSSSRLFSQLRRMARYGILGAYLPEFQRVIGQMQFDLFHIYTVDAHTLQVIRNMRRFRYRNQEQRFPIAAHIHPRLPKIELLYIAGLYHDIAKGLPGDHSSVGVSIVNDFCRRHQLGQWDTNLLAWLVENHLIMSSTAQRKDISDPKVIHDFARLVQDQVRLDYLYALTVADINATNPELWNSWRASLMHQLYQETKKMLKQGLEEPVDIEAYVEEVKETVMHRLLEKNIPQNLITEVWNDIDDEYFIRESAQHIVWHTEAILENRDRHKPLVMVRDILSRIGDEGATHIFVYCTDHKAVFLALVKGIDELGLNIVDARLTTTASNRRLDSFVVLEPDGKPVGDNAERIRRIRRTL
ncbi:MAG: [protein-PII] uridylyltransferase, partial [Gammaproteobacteria bacterium]|nr:[protein-PII] uridylyltransferase [Gammaproteobacteria bacterium]